MTDQSLDFLGGDDIETGAVGPKPLTVFDSRTQSTIVTIEEILKDKKGTWRGYEPVTLIAPDNPLGSLIEPREAGVAEGANGPFEYPAKDVFHLRFEFKDPDSPNQGRILSFHKDMPQTTQEGREEGTERDRKHMRKLIASFCQVAGHDVPITTDSLEDAVWTEWVGLASDVLPQFVDQEFWLQYQVSRWFANSDFGKRYPKGQWHFTQKPIRVGEG